MTFIASASTVAGQYHGRTITINGGVSTLFSIIVNEPGDGSETNPFRVYDVASLLQVGRNTRSGWTRSAHYRQEANIDIISIPNWTPIGTGLNPFIGTYNGDGYTIRNLTINSTYSARGLFGYVGAGGVVYHIALREVSITCPSGMPQWVGGVAGQNFGTIRNCYVTGNITSAYSYVGGVAGENNNGTIEDCHSSAIVTGVHTVGGVVGWSEGGIIRRCYATGDVRATNATIGNVGGVIGYMKDGTIQYLVALNKSVSSSSAHTAVGRVIGGLGSAAAPTSLYGRTDMTLTNSSGAVSPTSSTTGKDGFSITATQWNSSTWWNNSTTAGFGSHITDAWMTINNQLPRLLKIGRGNFNEHFIPVVNP